MDRAVRPTSAATSWIRRRRSVGAGASVMGTSPFYRNLAAYVKVREVTHGVFGRGQNRVAPRVVALDTPQEVVFMTKRFAALVAAIGLLAVAAFPAAARNAHANNSYTVNNLVSDSTDANLVNGWGISASSTSPWWVSDNGTDKSTLYTGAGTKIPLTVDVAGGPTGTVFKGSTDFLLDPSDSSTKAVFLFATEDGTIRGWNPGVPASTMTSTDTEVVATS